MVRRETDKTAGDIQARSFMARTLDETAQLKERQKWSHEKPKLDNDREITRNLFHWPWGQGVQRNHLECSKEIGNTDGFRYALQDMQEEQEWEHPYQE